VPAFGLCGADGGLIRARRLQRPGTDLGYVGEVDAVDPRPVTALLAAGYVPVIATVAPGPHGVTEPFYNLNADHAAGPLCRALSCDAALFLTDVPGVRGRGGQVEPRLTEADCDQLVADGTASGGMLPKLEAARRALRDSPRALVKIAPAAGDDAVLAALRPEVGTQLCRATHPDHTAGGAQHG
jgi:acetylglutamate kinase